MTSARERRHAAPGKLVVLGEYAVLDGAPALVVAVDRGVSCTVSPADALIVETPGSDDRFVRPALLAAGAPPARYRFTPWNQAPVLHGSEAVKVGLGTSAAATVVATAAARADGALDRPAIFALARRVHAEVQGSGSGIDVAASTWGGLLRYRPDAPEPQPRPAWQPTAVWSGTSAGTGPRVQRYLAWGAREDFVRHTTELVAAFPADPVGVLRSARRLLEAMAAAAGVDYRTPALDRICDLAEDHGGAAKPSGAGGGDVAIALFPDPDARVAFLRACAAHGLPEIPVRLADGVGPLETTP